MEKLHELLDVAASRSRFTADEKTAAISLLDDMYRMLETYKNPPGFKLASGDLATGATGRVALNSYFLLLGRLALGRDYSHHDDRFLYWKMRLGYAIMRGHFTGRAEKGIYCCPTCTLSVFPLYCLDAFDDLDCKLLKDNVFAAYTSKVHPFNSQFKQKYADWALSFL